MVLAEKGNCTGNTGSPRIPMTETEIVDLKTAIEKLAHDVRSPLTSIAGFARLLLEDESIDGENREFLSLIESDTEKLSQIMASGFAAIDAKLAHQ